MIPQPILPRSKTPAADPTSSQENVQRMSSTEATNSWAQVSVRVFSWVLSRPMSYVSKGIGAANKPTNNWQDPKPPKPPL